LKYKTYCKEIAGSRANMVVSECGSSERLKIEVKGLEFGQHCTQWLQILCCS